MKVTQICRVILTLALCISIISLIYISFVDGVTAIGCFLMISLAANLLSMLKH